MYSTRKVRESHGFSQNEIGQILGTSRSHILRHEVGQSPLHKDCRETLNRILLLTEYLPKPETLPDVVTPHLAEGVHKELDVRLNRLERLLAKSHRTLGLLQEANNRIKFKLEILAHLMGEWPETQGPRWEAMERIALGLMRKLKSCGPERQLKLKLHIEILESERDIVKRYRSIDLLKS